MRTKNKQKGAPSMKQDKKNEVNVPKEVAAKETEKKSKYINRENIEKRYKTRCDIFISYRRREGGYEYAGRIYERLSRFGYRVFMDERLNSGSFDEEIQKRICQCKDFLLVISPDSLEKKSGNDYYIKEIAIALEKNKNIIPIFLGDTSLPERNKLPKEIRKLADGKFEYPHKIFRPCDGSAFQKTTFTGMVNELVGVRNNNPDTERKLLHSKPVYKIKRRCFYIFAILTMIVILTVKNYGPISLYTKVKNDKNILQKKYNKLKDDTKYWDGTSAEEYASGSGSKLEPYVISTPQQLALLANKVNNGETYANTYFVIKNDIYLNNPSKIKFIIDINEEKKLIDNYQVWKPIGNEEYPFEGHFDGNNKIIYGMVIDAANSGSQCGLFGKCSKNSILNNVVVKEADVHVGKMSSKVELLCGESEGLINGCRVLLSSVSGTQSVGGIVGEGNIVLNSGAVHVDIYCDDVSASPATTGTIYKDYAKQCIYFGGIAGYVDFIANCNAIHISADAPGLYFGGIAGYVNTEIYSCIVKEIQIITDVYEVLNNYQLSCFPYTLGVGVYNNGLRDSSSELLDDLLLDIVTKSGKENKFVITENKNCYYSINATVDSYVKGFNDTKLEDSKYRRNVETKIQSLYPELYVDFLPGQSDVYVVNCCDVTFNEGKILYNTIFTKDFNFESFKKNNALSYDNELLLGIVWNYCKKQYGINLSEWGTKDFEDGYAPTPVLSALYDIDFNEKRVLLEILYGSVSEFAITPSE